MAQNLLIDLGTTIIPVAFPAATVAYATSFSPDKTKVFIDARLYTNDDVSSGQSMPAVFEALVKALPGVWMAADTNLGSKSVTPNAIVDDQYRFIRVQLDYDPREYAWTCPDIQQREWLSAASARRSTPIPTSAIIDVT
jgi:hypothetical protein